MRLKTRRYQKEGILMVRHRVSIRTAGGWLHEEFEVRATTERADIARLLAKARWELREANQLVTSFDTRYQNTTALNRNNPRYTVR